MIPVENQVSVPVHLVTTDYDMLRKFPFKLLPIVYRCRLANTLKHNVKCEYNGTLSSVLHAEANNCILHVDEQLQEIFKFKDTKISNWIIEVTSCIS